MFDSYGTTVVDRNNSQTIFNRMEEEMEEIRRLMTHGWFLPSMTMQVGLAQAYLRGDEEQLLSEWGERFFAASGYILPTRNNITWRDEKGKECRVKWPMAWIYSNPLFTVFSSRACAEVWKSDIKPRIVAKAKRENEKPSKVFSGEANRDPPPGKTEKARISGAKERQRLNRERAAEENRRRGGRRQGGIK